MSASWTSEDGKFRAFHDPRSGSVSIQEYIRDDGWFNVDAWVPYLECTREQLDFADKVLRELGLLCSPPYACLR